MKKAFKITIIVLFSIIWGFGFSDYYTVYSYLYRWGIIEDEYRYGDLFNLTHLPQFKEELVKCRSTLTSSKRSSRPIHLYAVGDSFLEPGRIDSSDLIADQYRFMKWGDFMHFKLDTSAVNIVLIESIERHFRQHLETPPVSHFIPDTADFIEKWEEKRWMAKIDNFVYADRVGGQISLLLTGNPLGLKFKELKSSFNYHVFDRHESSVTISGDGRDIVYYLDTDTLNFPYTSGFSRISESRIDSVVSSLNETREKLLDMGFDHLIFSVIPNKSTILMPDYGVYNRLIERVQSHPDLKVPYVSIINEFRAMGRNAFLLSDSHWTCDGRLVWLTKVNESLNQITTDTSGSGATNCLGPGTTKSLFRSSM
ncbi:MAG: hypothetical protein ABS46_15010 [Cytophagaceae bacterium SCN 52-12]|nr:MAG: hypothetical protein ABS46_15010 [Cytophagaceae bacterium SCN 52-12]